MKNYFFLLGMPFLFFAACATLPPREQRTVQYIETTPANKQTNFNRGLAYIGKSFGDSNSAIKMKNEATGEIVLKGNVSCSALKTFGQDVDHYLSFNLEFQSKDKKVRFIFEDLQMVDKIGTPVGFAVNQITDAAQLEKVKPCIETVKNGILRSISSTNDNW